ncbi:Uncharacterised protein [Mycobacteroides abscessus subsp. abscessus]|nr:Uncharacterised protein [Mycobacteroides abscessus subsp. abscessus]
MRILFSFFLLLMGGLFMGITVDNSILGNIIVKNNWSNMFCGFLKNISERKWNAKKTMKFLGEI